MFLKSVTSFLFVNSLRQTIFSIKQTLNARVYEMQIKWRGIFIKFNSLPFVVILYACYFH